MTLVTDTRRDPQRLTAALRLVLRRYYAQLRRRPAMTAISLLLPAVGDVLALYAPPLLIAKLLARFAHGERFTFDDLTLYVLAFAALWLSGQLGRAIGLRDDCSASFS